jgi:cytochrome c oxidase assembly protein subunit 15
VLTELHPVTVMAHFLLSMVLIAVAVDAYHRAGGGEGVAPVRREVRALARLLTAAVAVTIALGTVVTGTGPHSGDEDATDRLPFDLESVTQLHADAVFLVLGLTIGLLVAARAVAARELARRAGLLLAVVLAQGMVGYVQYVTDLPVLLVGVHVLGACLVWIATLRTQLAAGAAPEVSVSAGRRAEVGADAAPALPSAVR